MTFFEAVWKEAASTFAKRRGFPEALTPHGRTWKTVCARAEHALWVWNDKYGPLNIEQREYAGALVCHALRRARETAPSVGETYAYFHTSLTHLLNHERVHHGFTSRSNRGELDAALLDSLPDVFLEVA